MAAAYTRHSIKCSAVNVGRQYGGAINIDRHLDLISLNCTISGFNFSDNKNFYSPSLTGFSHWLHDQHARSRDETGCKYPVLIHKFQLLAPAHLPYYTRRNALTSTSSKFLKTLFSLIERAKFSNLKLASYRNYCQAFPTSV